MLQVLLGGRRLRYAAIFVVGDHNGGVGDGTVVNHKIPEAIRKAVKKMLKNLIEVPMVGEQKSHEEFFEFSGAIKLLKPAVEGSGVAELVAVRAVVELRQVWQILHLTLGSKTLQSTMFVQLLNLKNN